MFETVSAAYHAGKKPPRESVVLGLSTCAFCKRARAFLEESGVEFRYIVVDELPQAEREAVHAEFAAAFGIKPMYPALVLGQKDYLPGFIRPAWEQALGLAGGQSEP